jgi:signal transduction histidine kinase
MMARRADPPPDLNTRVRLEELLSDVAARFLDLPADEVFEEIGRAQRRLCDLLGYDRSTIWQLPGPDSRTLELLSVVHPSDLPQPPARMDAGTSWPYSVARVLEGHPVILASLAELPANAERDLESHRHFGTKSSAIFPLHAGGRVFGALTFATTSAEREWPVPVVRRLELVAQIFASALIRKDADAELRAVSGRLIHAQEKERARLAQELHDGLSQQLAVLAVELDLLGQRPPATAAEARACLADLSAKTKALSADVHRLSHGLHPAKLQQLGLVAAVGGFCRDLQATERVQVRFSAEDVPETLSDDVALSLYRVAQEALWNVVKHSGARNAAVKLTGDQAEIRLDITDDGCGFDPASTPPAASLGLLGMRERVTMVGGQIRWDPAPGGGTTVHVRLPLPPRAPA